MVQSRLCTFIIYFWIILTTYSSSFRSSSLPVETTSKASSSHSGVIPTKTCVYSDFLTYSRNVTLQILTAFSSFPCSSSPLVASPHSSIHSTRTPTHVLSSPASTFNSVAAATGSVSLSSRTSKVAYLSIGGAIAGFFLILIVAFIVSLSRRRKRRHSFVIPGIRHPFRPTNTARLDEDPFSGALKLHSHSSRVHLPIQNSGLGYSDWPYSRAPPTNSRYSISTIPLSATSMSSPNSSTADNKKSFSQCSPPPLEDEESNTPESPPMIQITFDWERSQWPGYLNNRRPHDRTTWRWSTASQTFSSIFPMAILRP